MDVGDYGDSPTILGDVLIHSKECGGVRSDLAPAAAPQTRPGPAPPRCEEMAATEELLPAWADDLMIPCFPLLASPSQLLDILLVPLAAPPQVSFDMYTESRERLLAKELPQHLRPLILTKELPGLTPDLTPASQESVPEPIPEPSTSRVDHLYDVKKWTRNLLWVPYLPDRNGKPGVHLFESVNLLVMPITSFASPYTRRIFKAVHDHRGGLNSEEGWSYWFFYEGSCSGKPVEGACGLLLLNADAYDKPTLDEAMSCAVNNLHMASSGSNPGELIHCYEEEFIRLVSLLLDGHLRAKLPDSSEDALSCGMFLMNDNFSNDRKHCDRGISGVRSGIVGGLEFDAAFLLDKDFRTSEVELHKRFLRQRDGFLVLRKAIRFIPAHTVCEDKSIPDISLAKMNIFLEGPFSRMYKKSDSIDDVKGLSVMIIEPKENSDGHINFFKQLVHPNVARIHGYDPKSGCLYIESGACTLRNYAAKEANRSNLEMKMLEILLNVARAMDYLHSHGVLHGCLSMDNIVMRERTNPADLFVCEHGLRFFSRQYEYVRKEYVRPDPILSSPPEYLIPGEGSFSTHSDVWSFGLLVAEIVSGQSCLIPLTEGPEKLQSLFRGDWSPPALAKLPQWAQKLVSCCLSVKRGSRPDFLSICHFLERENRFRLRRLHPELHWIEFLWSANCHQWDGRLLSLAESLGCQHPNGRTLIRCCLAACSQTLFSLWDLKLDPSECAALSIWLHAGNLVRNARSGSPLWTELSSAVLKFPRVPPGKPVFRGEGRSNLFDVEHGSVITVRNFFSGCLVEKPARQYGEVAASNPKSPIHDPVFVRIDICQETAARDLSRLNPVDEEAIFVPMTQFRVISREEKELIGDVRTRGSRRTGLFITVEEVDRPNV